MKILFAVNNDNVSEAIVKKYQNEYREIVSYKNVYYFNAILKELQNNKDYDVVVVSEDLEPFANNNYDTIDKFLFEKLEKIKEETKKINGEDIEVVLICADRRSPADEMIKKIFGIKIYNALIGDERNIDTLCKLMNNPRTKKEARVVYKIESNNGMADDESGVSESEVQNILAHYKRLGKNEDKYVDSFNNIVSQYTDAQLKIIIRYLPLNVKAVLEERSPKYQELSTFSVGKNIKETKTESYTPRTSKTVKRDVNVTMLNNEKDKINSPIVIPSELNKNKTIKIQQKEIKKEEIPEVQEETLQEDIVEEPKRGRGRPRKNQIQEVQEEKPKRGRGRPKKEEIVNEQDEDMDINLFSWDDEDNEEKTTTLNNEQEDMDFDLFNMENDAEEKADDDFDLFNMEQEQEEKTDEEFDLFNMENDSEVVNENETDDIDLFSMDNENIVDNPKEETEYEVLNDFKYEKHNSNSTYGRQSNEEENHYIEPTVKTVASLSSLQTNEKKIVSFVGTTKNGTSFIVNNLGLTLADMNISTAILDMSQNKNAYYIFTNNDDRLRKIAENSISNLEKGIAEGIKISKNLTIYTEIPGTGKTYKNIENILASLLEKHDVVLIDTDFNTDIQFFEMSQEIYLVQSMDVLTIQPLTAFLRNLKTKGILRQEKIKIVINKEQRLKDITDRVLIGGISTYNDPSMTLMTELFDKDNVKYCKVPFEVQNYSKYLASLANCELYLRGYTKQLLQALNQLAEMVYPLLNKNKYEPKNSKKSRMEFSDSTRDTLNKMRKNY